MTNGQFLLVRVLVVAAVSALLLWLGYGFAGTTGLAIGMVLCAPVAGMALAKPLVELSAEGLEWIAKSPHKKWNGHYYAFDDIQVRADDEGDRLLLAGVDVCKACGIAVTPEVKARIDRLASGRLARTSVAAVPWQAIDVLLGPDAGREAGRFKLWLRREVVAPWHQRRNLPFDPF